MEFPIPIGMQIRMVNNLISRHIDNSPINKQLSNMTGTNAWLIAYISEENNLGRDVFQKDIEETFGVTRSTVSKVVKLMEKKGLISRQKVDYDGRLKKLVLTENSNEIVSLLQEDKLQTEQTVTEGFSEEELQTLSEYLVRIEKNLGHG